MKFGSVCSGIEGASVAFAPLGWTCAFMAETDPAARAVLKYRYPEVKLYGDFTKIQAEDCGPIDALVGGTPCQSFSTAGLREGLGDARGNLALEYLRLADRLRPRWLIWENVPGVLSSTSHDAPDPCQPPDDLEEGAEWVGEDEYDADENHAFSCFLAGLSELGYGFAYASPDAQYFGLAQRRKRVFVVGHSGANWRRCTAALLNPASMRWDSAPRRAAGQNTAGTLASRTTGGGGLGTDFDLAGGLIAADIAPAVTSNPYGDHESREGLLVVHSFQPRIGRNGRGDGGDIVGALNVQSGRTGKSDAAPCVAVTYASGNTSGAIDVATACLAKGGTGHHDFESETFVVKRGVRRLTPRETERLQGFPDDWTLVPYRGKPMGDGPRYKLVGNSFPVPVVRWIGSRIAKVDRSEPVTEDQGLDP